MVNLFKSLGLQARFMMLAGVGVLTIAGATMAFVSWFEFASVENRLRDLSSNELTSLEALVETAMTLRSEDPQAVKVFNGWFESRNKEYAGKLWSVWSPKMIENATQSTPGQAIKRPLDDIDREVLRTGRPVARFAGGAYRYSRPVILGKTLAAPKEDCEGCHSRVMDMKDGEVIAVLSSSLSTAAD